MNSENECCHSEKKSRKPSCCDSANNRQRKIDFLFWGSLIGVSILMTLHIVFPNMITGYERLSEMAVSVHHMLGAMWWGVAIGAVFIGLLSKIPREVVMSVLGKAGSTSGLFRAVGAGVLLDMCSHGILMVASKLYERGASAGQVMAFLLASPWNSFSLTLVLIGLIGWKWTVLFVVLSCVVALITGKVFDVLVDRKVLPPNVNHISLPDDFKMKKWAKESLKLKNLSFKFFKEVIISGVIGAKMVVRWLLFGVLLASALRAFIDTQLFEQYFGPTFIGLIITVFAATILEVCSEGSAPIAADVVNRANAPGNGFAFLMAGVATDYTEIMVIKDTTKSWKIALFLPLISVPQVILISLVINYSL